MGILNKLAGLRGKAPAGGKSPDPKPEPRFTSVEIIPAPGVSCKAVQRLVGQRLLCSEAPLVPLPNCDQPRCDCKYRRYDDRRAELRRGEDVGFCTWFDDSHSESRRAKTPGRRSTDGTR